MGIREDRLAGAAEVTFIVRLNNGAQDLLVGKGAYARIERDGTLCVFSGYGLGLGKYTADIWESVSRTLPRA